MSPPSLASAALRCMQDIQLECFKIGIPLKTRHREVALNQYEFATMFGLCTTQVDQNLMVMQIAEEVAVKHGLAALFHEKPFAGINGSGKHVNWSIHLDDGTNLFNYKQVTKATNNANIFPTMIAAMVAAVDQHGDLMRMAIATPGNDFRLGAMEAPPAITSIYLGTDLTNYMEQVKNSGGEAEKPYQPRTKTIDLGVETLPTFETPSEDRNRTSSFPFTGGNRFEFRSVGSSQNVSMVNTVLCAITASVFKQFADEIEFNKKSPQLVVKEALNKHWKSIFNGNGYSPEEQERITKAGLWRIDSGVEAMKRLTAPKNVKLFEDLGIFTEDECKCRQHSMLSHYVGVVEIETQVMVDMVQTQILPVVKAHGLEGAGDLVHGRERLMSALQEIHAAHDIGTKATLARTLRMGLMQEVRGTCDKIESLAPANAWPMPTYQDLLFLDQNTI
jgi:glutamine synthetase